MIGQLSLRERGIDQHDILSARSQRFKHFVNTGGRVKVDSAVWDVRSVPWDNDWDIRILLKMFGQR